MAAVSSQQPGMGTHPRQGLLIGTENSTGQNGTRQNNTRQNSTLQNSTGQNCTGQNNSWTAQY